MKYMVHGLITVSCWTEVEANSKAEALEIAASRDMAEHHIDGSYPQDECWHFDNDGEPEMLRLEDEDD